MWPEVFLNRFVGQREDGLWQEIGRDLLRLEDTLEGYKETLEKKMRRLDTSSRQGILPLDRTLQELSNGTNLALFGLRMRKLCFLEVCLGKMLE